MLFDLKEASMIELIGSAAGDLWKALGRYDKVEIARLPRLLNREANIVYQALGWLAREDKIRYEQKGNKTYVGLTPNECAAFERNRVPATNQETVVA
jgi:Winged helix-turn-helix domain (DUF2582)